MNAIEMNNMTSWIIGWLFMAGSTIGSMGASTTKKAIPFMAGASLGAVYVMRLPQPTPDPIWWLTSIVGTAGLAGLCCTGSNRLQAGGLAAALFATMVALTLTLGRVVGEEAG